MSLELYYNMLNPLRETETQNVRKKLKKEKKITNNININNKKDETENIIKKIGYIFKMTNKKIK